MLREEERRRAAHQRYQNQASQIFKMSHLRLSQGKRKTSPILTLWPPTFFYLDSKSRLLSSAVLPSVDTTLIKHSFLDRRADEEPEQDRSADDVGM